MVEPSVVLSVNVSWVLYPAHGPVLPAGSAVMFHAALSLTGLVVFASTQTVAVGVTGVRLDCTLDTVGSAV